MLRRTWSFRRPTSASRHLTSRSATALSCVLSLTAGLGSSTLQTYPTLTSRHPLEAHLFRVICEQGAEAKLGWFGALEMVP